MSEVQKQLITEVNRAFNTNVKVIEDLLTAVRKIHVIRNPATNEQAYSFLERIEDLQDLQDVKRRLITDVNEAINVKAASVTEAISYLTTKYKEHVEDVEDASFSSLERDSYVNYEVLLNRCAALRWDLDNVSTNTSYKQPLLSRTAFDVFNSLDAARGTLQQGQKGADSELALSELDEAIGHFVTLLKAANIECDI